MKISRLKKIRVVVSILFLLLFSILFLDFTNFVSPRYTNYITYLQFVPSLLKFINVFNITAAGFIFVIILTLILGRIYCSTVCPLGILQDVISFFARKLNKKKYYHPVKENNRLRYSFLFLAVIAILTGSMIVITLLDPYSNFGRIFTQLFKPVVLAANNFLAYTLTIADIYSVYPQEIKPANIWLMLFPIFFLSLIVWMSYKHGRLFCNTVCPVGSLLGLLSRLSFYKVEINKDNCIGCKLCERVCKSGCIDKENKTVDYSRCVDCFNCFTVCPTEGIKYSRNYPWKNKEVTSVEFDYKKREFISSIVWFSIGTLGTTYAQKKIISKKPSTFSILKKIPVSPPGSVSINNFTGSCTACSICISACPSQVLQPSFLDYGFIGMLQPKMDFNIGFCNFECVICSQVCPGGAILPIALEKKKLTQLGKAKFVKENCIVFTEKTDCGACAEHCPTKAITMVPYENIKSPEVKDEYCIGCGACEYACPTKPYKAIYVEGNPVHLTAKKKEEKKLQEKIDYNDDFPF